MVRILYNSKFTLTSKIAGNKQCRYKEGWLYNLKPLDMSNGLSQVYCINPLLYKGFINKYRYIIHRLASKFGTCIVEKFYTDWQMI